MDARDLGCIVCYAMFGLAPCACRLAVGTALSLFRYCVRGRANGAHCTHMGTVGATRRGDFGGRHCTRTGGTKWLGSSCCRARGVPSMSMCWHMHQHFRTVFLYVQLNSEG